jgi:hypothetical protein
VKVRASSIAVRETLVKAEVEAGAKDKAEHRPLIKVFAAEGRTYSQFGAQWWCEKSIHLVQRKANHASTFSSVSLHGISVVITFHRFAA